jgi:TRAP-type mannitol/chloroaromatic compound transport system substrate-binding protein
MDEKLGWHKVAKYYYYPFGEPTFSTVSDLLINRQVWDGLDTSSKQLFEAACQQQLRSDYSKLTDGVSASLTRFKAGGTVVGPVPDAIIATHRQGAEAYLDQNVRSSAGLAAWRSLKAAR